MSDNGSSHAELLRQNIALREQLAERDVNLLRFAAIEQELRDSEERYRRLIELSPDPIVIHSQGKIIDINTAGARIVGASGPAELLGRGLMDFVHPAYHGVVQQRVEMTQGQRLPTDLREEQFLRLDGSTVDVETISFPITYAGVPATQVVVRDISERKRGERAMQFLAEASSVLANSLDQETTLEIIARIAVPELSDWCIIDLIEQDQRLTRILTHAADAGHEALLNEMQRLYPPTWDSPQPAARALRNSRPLLISTFSSDTLAATAYDDRHLALLHALAPQSAMAIPMMARGQTVGVLTLATSSRGRHYDAADLRLAEELARRAAVAVDNARLYQEAQRAIAHEAANRRRAEQAERRKTFMAEAVSVLSTSIDYDQTLRNLAQLLVPGLATWCIVDIAEQDGTIRRVAAAHADPNKRELVEQLLKRYTLTWDTPHPAVQAMRTGAVVSESAANPNYLRDDHHRLVVQQLLEARSWLAAPLIARGHTLGAITLIAVEHGHFEDPESLELAREVANRAAQAIDNARLYREAQQAIHIRDQFLSLASHELKTPLTTLLGNTQLLARRLSKELSVSERDRRVITVIGEQARRLNRMITALLDVSRIETGQLQIERTRLDIGALLEQLVADMQLASEAHSIELARPSCALMVLGDELRLEQVFQNLLQNAIKYSPNGGKIEVCAEQRGQAVHIVVTDHGIGIPAAAMPMLFRRFYRAANADPHHISGLGIGLFVVREIVMLHGGQVHVSSDEGRGTTFTVELPSGDG